MNPTPRRALQSAAALCVAAALAGCGVAAPQAPVGPSVPDVVEDPLDLGKATLRAASFTGRPQDLLGGRSELVDGNWIICTQDPEPGPAAEGTVVELGVVKDVEACPGSVPTATPPTATTPPATSVAAVRPQPASQHVPQPEPAP
ncbi:hypothetical protein [Pseudonocardia sp. MH-G8]|uniref:hypothetical protein n=1 Tax=Pseudonocardia sp. MH-G8 TaxID=1854588 RepID=UPI000B9FE516|nr:hypothetical protein [Pseudonocardia sp. MH-G8]OZM79475.1 hypothetical protein CFP66_25195 [Pseudonocardia sp. MH-G8]